MNINNGDRGKKGEDIDGIFQWNDNSRLFQEIYDENHSSFFRFSNMYL